MKKIVTVLCLVMFFTSLFAQKKIKVSESSENIGNGQHNALIVNIYEADESSVLKEWKKLMKGYKAKVSSKKEVFADDASIKSMSDNTMDVYARVEKSKDGDVKLIVAFDLGGAFLSSSKHPDKFKEAKKIVYNFAIKATKNAIQGQLKEAEKIFGKLEKEQEQLIKENGNFHKDIEDYKKRITQAEDDIKANEKEQEEKKIEIENQKKEVERIAEKEKAVK